jgi:PAS domain S-box-containing protein
MQHRGSICQHESILHFQNGRRFELSSRKPKKNYRATFSSHPDSESLDDKDLQIRQLQGKVERLQEEIQKQKSGRIEAEKDLEEHRRIMQQILDTTPLPVFYKDSDAHYAGCNKAYERAVDLPRNSIVGKTVFDLEPADLARKFSELDAQVLRRPGIHTRRASFLYPNGSRQDATYIKTALHDTEGKVCGLVGIILPDDLPQNYREIEKLTGRALAQLPSAHLLFLQEKERAWLSRGKQGPP